MPRLVLKFGEVRKLLLEQDFVLDRQNGTSHGQYVKRDENDKITHRTTLAGSDSDTILDGTLSSIIRQSGLPKKLFKNLQKSKKALRAEAKRAENDTDSSPV